MIKSENSNNDLESVITLLKDELLKKENQIKNIHKLLDNILNNDIFHDLGNNLSTIIGNSNLIKIYSEDESNIYQNALNIEKSALEAKVKLEKLISMIKNEIKSVEIKKDEIKENTLFSGAGRILIMDDDESIMECTKDILTYLGYDVDCAQDGIETIKKYKKSIEDNKKYNVVLIDLTIKIGMNGRDAITELKKIDPLINAIVSSGFSNDPIISDYKEYGFIDVITKPYKIEDLSRIIFNIISKK